VGYSLSYEQNLLEVSEDGEESSMERLAQTQRNCTVDTGRASTLWALASSSCVTPY